MNVVFAVVIGAAIPFLAFRRYHSCCISGVAVADVAAVAVVGCCCWCCGCCCCSCYYCWVLSIIVNNDDDVFVIIAATIFVNTSNNAIRYVLCFVAFVEHDVAVFGGDRYIFRHNKYKHVHVHTYRKCFFLADFPPLF
jgi:hypothetical protein